MSEILDVVDDNDKVIATAERDEVHRVGPLCRLVYVLFFTQDGQVILQKRGMVKKNDAGKLTTTVSGHVISGQSYRAAAIKETLEEAGIQITEGELIDLGVVRADFTQGTYISNAMRALFAYKFNGSLLDLKVEPDEGAGFVSMPIEELEKQLHVTPGKFAQALRGDIGQHLIGKIKELLANESQ